MRTSHGQNAILTGSIPRQLLLFFLPIWFGTLFQQLYNTADTLIVGNFVGTQALAAVGATGAFVQLLVGVFVGLCSGAGVVIEMCIRDRCRTGPAGICSALCFCPVHGQKGCQVYSGRTGHRGRGQGH